jgi:hypothetical protein
MPTLVSLNGNIAFKRGTTAKNLTYTGPDGTISIDTEKKEIRLHDGVTAGGVVANQNAATAVKLATARNINGVAFDGTANITINATDATARIASSEKGAANGVATLDGAGKVPVAQLPDSVLGGMIYQGSWNASTNTPTLATGVGTKGFYYKVSTDGTTTIDGINRWQAGDLIAYNGTAWDKIDGGVSEVYSVAGRTGDVVLTKSDVGLANVANVDTTNASNISSGTLAAARMPAHTGDVTAAAGSTVMTLANSGVGAGTYRSVTVDAKGRVTGGTNPTTLAGYGITDAQPLDADLTSIAGLAGTSGLLRKTAANTWTLETATYLTANQNIAVTGDATGSGTTAIALTLANSGVTAGTYEKVTVDAKGRVTSGGDLVATDIMSALNDTTIDCGLIP